MSADDIAAHLGVTKDTVYTWIAEKAMPAHKVGRLWKFQASEIDDWVRRGGAAAAPNPPHRGERIARPEPLTFCRWHHIS
ncbi:helix-turn-helix domain-containing protein [Dermabacter sp.]|uniref:helix-turn-helix domain-containing protein n=1 Tax=Dermabacter sp. TaxID=37640 RepID=UPI00290E546B|nr:helix-turn-helix domain-containing protein [Dermabacter sp.]MDU4923983.1 helix-turn-helix domain-containing protein [Dermabacter sp.]